SSSSSSDYGLLGKIGQGVWDGPEGLAFDYLTGNMEDMSAEEAVAYGAGVAVSALAYAPMKVVKGIGLGFKALRGIATMGKANKAIKATKLAAKTEVYGVQKATKVFQKRFGIGYDKFKYLRKPQSIQDIMVREAARAGAGKPIKSIRLGDPRYIGWVKMQYREVSNNGLKSTVHYVLNLSTGEVKDIKFINRAGNILYLK
ncbi:MAG: hypothetical protein L7U87_05410, partial [Chlamydiales bacterium]|nr:hypothetical protein [Chlamydiales bacterium]